ncbi:MAG: hypothetical protein ACTHOR_09445 [Devosia sp.]|jgi:hypothetical protein
MDRGKFRPQATYLDRLMGILDLRHCTPSVAADEKRRLEGGAR